MINIIVLAKPQRQKHHGVNIIVAFKEGNDLMITKSTLPSPFLLHYISFWIPIHWTHWCRVTRKCVNKLSIISSNNGLSHGRRQAIIWTNARILLIGPLGTKFNDIYSKFIHFHSRRYFWKYRLENNGHLVSVSICYFYLLWAKWYF